MPSSPNAPPDSDAQETVSPRRPSLLEAIVPVLVMAALLGIGYGVVRLRIEMLLLAAAGTAALVALRLGHRWRALEAGIVDAIARAMPPTLIMIVVGMMISSWIASGTIPMLMSYGLALIHPAWFLVTACLVCSVVSVLTGTSYGTAGTIGVAFIGIAQGLGISPGMAAGAVVAGAYFGDKISPFSDTTNLAAAVARTNIFDHILHMQWTTVPAFVLGLLVYAIAGQSSSAPVGADQVTVLRVVLEKSFVFHWSLMLPPIIVLVLAFRKFPPLPAMVLSSAVAIGCAVAVQGAPLGVTLEACVVGYRAATGSPGVDLLLSRGGMQAMMDVILVALCAFAFAGIMQKAAMLDVILENIRQGCQHDGSADRFGRFGQPADRHHYRQLISECDHSRRTLCRSVPGSEAGRKEPLPHHGRLRDRRGPVAAMEHGGSLYGGNTWCPHAGVCAVGRVLLYRVPCRTPLRVYGDRHRSPRA